MLSLTLLYISLHLLSISPLHPPPPLSLSIYLSLSCIPGITCVVWSRAPRRFMRKYSSGLKKMEKKMKKANTNRVCLSLYTLSLSHPPYTLLLTLSLSLSLSLSLPSNHSSTEEEEEKNLKGSSHVDLVFSPQVGKNARIWKNVLISPSSLTSSPSHDFHTYVEALRFFPFDQPWAVLLCSGGSFAGGLFESDGKCIAHKAVHRYTVRKKQGGSQASKDGQSGTSAPKSAGSSLRRYNWTRLVEVCLSLSLLFFAISLFFSLSLYFSPSLSLATTLFLTPNPSNNTQ